MVRCMGNLSTTHDIGEITLGTDVGHHWKDRGNNWVHSETFSRQGGYASVADRWLSKIPIELEYRDTQISWGGVVKGLSPVERSRRSNSQCSVLP